MLHTNYGTVMYYYYEFDSMEATSSTNIVFRSTGSTTKGVVVHSKHYQKKRFVKTTVLLCFTVLY
jgi:hypothetical protein